MDTTGTLAKPVALIADADVRMRDYLAHNLEADGFVVNAVSSTEAALEQCATVVPDVAIVAVNCGGGLEFARLVRAGVPGVDVRLPLVLVGDAFVERALNAGADDYVDDPRGGYRELLARTRALLRRSALNRSAPTPSAQIGDLRIDYATRAVHVRDEPVRLSPKEFELLCALAREPTAVRTKDDLLREIWGWGYGSETGVTRTLDSHACRLRNKLCVDGRSLIQNVWGVGYRLTDSASL